MGFVLVEMLYMDEKIVSDSLMLFWQGELQEKIQIVHEDITNHEIDREILKLQRQIDRANVNGWRREYPLDFFSEYWQAISFSTQCSNSWPLISRPGVSPTLLWVVWHILQIKKMHDFFFNTETHSSIPFIRWLRLVIPFTSLVLAVN